MLLQVNNIVVHYGSAEAIRGVSLEVAPESVTFVIGANGAGKSSILKAITGLIPLSRGEILFLGDRISGRAVHEIVNLGIALVPEGRRPFPFMSVLSNLKLGAYLQKDKKTVQRSMDELFERFPVLGKRRRQRAGTLSGGEQQMLVIARALMAKPRLILMDEPTLGLAPIVIQELDRVIRDILTTGISVLLVEQNATLVSQVSNRGYVIELGRVVLEGNIRDLMAEDLVQKAFLGG